MLSTPLVLRLAEQDVPLLVARDRALSASSCENLMGHFLKALDEERNDGDGNVESATYLVYRAVGDEAAYHLGGLYAGDGRGDAATELEYLDYRLKRFNNVIRIWQMEMEWDADRG